MLFMIIAESIILFITFFQETEATLRHVNIGLLVTKKRDVDSIALENSIAWSHKHVLKGKGVIMNPVKIVIKQNHLLHDPEVFARNLSFLLEPYHTDSRACILSDMLDIPIIIMSGSHPKSCKNAINMRPSPKQIYHVFNEFLIEEDIPNVDLIIESGMGDTATDIISHAATTKNRVYYSILATVDMSKEEDIQEVRSELLTGQHHNVVLIMRSYNIFKFLMRAASNITHLNWFVPLLHGVALEKFPLDFQVYGLTIPIDENRFKAVVKDISNMKTIYERPVPGFLKIDPLLHDAIVIIATAIRDSSLDLSRVFDRCFCNFDRRNRFQLSKLMKNQISFQGVTGNVQFVKEGYRDLPSLEASELTASGNMTRLGRWIDACQVFRYDNVKTQNRVRKTKKKKKKIGCNQNFKRVAITSKIRRRHLKVVTLLEAPLMYYNESYGTGNNRFRGFCKDLLETLSSKLHFTYDLYVVSSYGNCEKVDADGPCVWNGLIGEIVNKKADIALGSITITSEREEYVDFSKPFMDFTMTLIMQKPEGEHFDVYAFLKPFEYSVWLSIMGVAFVVTVTLFFIDRYSPNGCQELSKKESSELSGKEFAFHNCMWFITASLLQQGPDYTPKSSAARILSATFWFFTLIMISTYTANLAAFFTTNQSKVGINSLEDLAKQDELSYGILGHGQTYSLFKNSEISIYKQMFNFMKSRRSFATSSKSGVERVRQGGYAYLSEDPIIYYQHQRAPCNTAVVRNLLEAKSYGLVLQQQSEWTNPISVVILDLREQGYIEKIRAKWWDEASECNHGPQRYKGQPISLKVSSLAGIYVIMVCGVTLACIFLFIETKYHKVFSNGRCLRKHYTFNKSGKMQNEITFIDHCETDQCDPIMHKLQNQMSNSQELGNEKTKRSLYSPDGTPPLPYNRYMDVPEQFRDVPESTL